MTGHDPVTIKKYLEKTDFNQKKSEPKDGSPSPSLAPYKGIIDEWLLADKGEKPKQRHNIVRIVERLQEEHGYTGAYGTVWAYVKWK